MRFTVELTPEEEARLAAKAKAQGVSVDVLVRNVLNGVATDASSAALSQPTEAPALPKWRGRVIGPLRREDIYEDVR